MPLVGYSILRLRFFGLNRLGMLLRINKMDKVLLLFLLFLLMNLFKCLWIGLGMIFYCFLNSALVCEYWWVRILAILGGFNTLNCFSFNIFLLDILYSFSLVLYIYYINCLHMRSIKVYNILDVLN